MSDDPKRHGFLDGLKDDATLWFWLVAILGGVALTVALVKWILGVEA